MYKRLILVSLVVMGLCVPAPLWAQGALAKGHSITLALRRALPRLGSRMDIITTKIATTTSSSISVKARDRRQRCNRI